MGTRIIFNGQEYSSSEAMPPSVRQTYEQALAQLTDADQNGIPDILERGAAAGNVIGIQHTSITINGRTFNSVDEMPLEVRRIYEEAIAHVDANRNGVPDAVESSVTGATTPKQLAAAVRREFTWGGGIQRPTSLTTLSGLRGRGLRFFALVMVGLVVLLLWWQLAR